MKKFLFAISVCFIVFSSCQKEITLNDSNFTYEPALFIECILVPGENPKVYLSNSLPFFNEKVTPREIFTRDARVFLDNGIEMKELLPDSTFDKFRCRWNPYYTTEFNIERGGSYGLTVEHQGETYSAHTEIMQGKVDIDEVEYTPEFFDIYGGHDGVIIRLKDIPDEENYYRFQMDRWIDNTRLHAHVLDVITSDCTTEGELFYVKDQGRTVFSDAANDGDDFEFYLEVSFEYLKGDTATIYMQSLDPESAAFFQDLDLQFQSIVNPFVEPSFIHSTIEGALGVFGSVVLSDPVHFTYPQDNP